MEGFTQSLWGKIEFQNCRNPPEGSDLVRSGPDWSDSVLSTSTSMKVFLSCLDRLKNSNSSKPLTKDDQRISRLMSFRTLETFRSAAPILRNLRPFWHKQTHQKSRGLWVVDHSNHPEQERSQDVPSPSQSLQVLQKPLNYSTKQKPRGFTLISRLEDGIALGPRGR